MPWTTLASLAACGIGLILLFFVNPSEVNWLPRCYFHELTGLHCPGCGTTRAYYQLLHGHVATALSLNALTVLGLPLLIYVAAADAVQSLTGKPPTSLRVPAWFGWSLLALAIAFAILRNIPVYPLTLLAP